MERNRISSLQSHGKALEKECCLPSVFCDSDGTFANLLCELNGHLMPFTSCFYDIIIIIIIFLIIIIKGIYIAQVRKATNALMHVMLLYLKPSVSNIVTAHWSLNELP